MISEVEIIGVIGSDTANGIAEITVPTNKIDGIGEIIPISSPVTRAASIFFPRFIQRLGITIGRGGSGTWEKEETGGARWFGFGLEF